MSKQAPRILRRRALLFWLTLLLCCAALAAGQWALARQNRRAEAVERDFQDRLDAVYRAVIPYRDKSAAQVAAGLNAGRPLIGQAGKEARPVATLTGTVFDDRRALPAGVSPLALAPSFRAEVPGEVIGRRFQGWIIHLHFVDDKLCGAYTITPPHVVYAGPSGGWLTMQLALAGLVYIGAGLWCLSALLLPFNRPSRRQIAQEALAGLLVAALAQALGPGWSLPSLSLSGIGHAPLLAAVVAAALFSLISLLVPPRRARRRDGVPPCLHCGYDLTGNLSGTCPECGRYTPKGLIDRWRDEADRVARVQDSQAEQEEEESIDASGVEAAASPPSAENEEGEEFRERPPVLAPWVPQGVVHPHDSDDRSKPRQPTAQASVGVQTF
jgi:hypothetical protein